MIRHSVFTDDLAMSSRSAGDAPARDRTATACKTFPARRDVSSIFSALSASSLSQAIRKRRANRSSIFSMLPVRTARTRLFDSASVVATPSSPSKIKELADECRPRRRARASSLGGSLKKHVSCLRSLVAKKPPTTGGFFFSYAPSLRGRATVPVVSRWPAWPSRVLRC